MSRKLNHVTAFPYPDQTFYRAVSRKDYWEQRIAELDGPGAELVAFDLDGDRIGVEVTKIIPASELPGPAAVFRPSGVTYRYTETWRALPEGGATGKMAGHVEGITIAIDGDLLLRGDDTSCELVLDATVSARVPLIGKTIEAELGKTFDKEADAISAFTMKWLESAR